MGCLLVLSSCTSHTEQAKPTAINGQVRTYGTTEQAEHPPILLQLVHAGASGAIGGGRSYSVLDETWSDQDGYFSLNASLFANEEYYLMADYNSVKRNKG